jgi:hypothetical protein
MRTSRGHLASVNGLTPYHMAFVQPGKGSTHTSVNGHICLNLYETAR